MSLPPPLTEREGATVDQLYRETMDQHYGLRVNETSRFLEPRDDASSSSIIVEPDFIVLDPPAGNLPDHQPHGASSNNFILESMTDVRLRRTETGSDSDHTRR